MNKIQVSLKVLRSVPLDIVPEDYKDVVEQLLEDMKGKDDALLTIATNDEVFKAFIKRAEKTFFAATEEAEKDTKARRFVASGTIAYYCASCEEQHECDVETAMGADAHEASNNLMTQFVSTFALLALTGSKGFVKTFNVEEVKENA